MEYHILNGDALKDCFPKDIKGGILVARECLVDGDVQSKDLEELFNIRAAFIKSLIGDGFTAGDYYSETVTEFQNIMDIPDRSIINLWFEDDLFCQVNFWFVIYLVYHFTNHCTVNLVRPAKLNQYGFGAYNETGLMELYENRIPLTGLDRLSLLWEFYKDNKTDELSAIAEELKPVYPFIADAVKAHQARLPSDDSPGRPTEILQEIISELGTREFGPIFKAFNKRAYIYGFGDLQVKRMFDEIINLKS